MKKPHKTCNAHLSVFIFNSSTYTLYFLCKKKKKKKKKKKTKKFYCDKFKTPQMFLGKGLMLSLIARAVCMLFDCCLATFVLRQHASCLLPTFLRKNISCCENI